jgi:thiol-disulfide isomerase/thioredoxin
MPKLTVTNIENSIVQLPINQPGKYNLIEFWGTWCGPCTALYPRLDSVLKANAHILSYTGITGHDDKEKMLRYISKKPTIKNQVFEPDKNKSIVSLFKITAFPTFILVDDKGIIVAKKSGSAGLDVVEKLINEAGARQIKSSKTD